MTLRILKRLAMAGATQAAEGALFAAVGGPVLKATGHAGYQAVRSLVRASAAGNAVMGAMVGFVTGCCTEEKSFAKESVQDGALGVLYSMAGAALGYSMLGDVPLREVVFATGTGGGVIAGGVIATAIVLVGLGYCIGACLQFSSSVVPVTENSVVESQQKPEETTKMTGITIEKTPNDNVNQSNEGSLIVKLGR